MNQKSIKEKAANTLVGYKNEHNVWVNGETSSMASPLAVAGSSIGIVACLIASVFLNMNYELNSRFRFILFLIPLFFAFFGAISGTIIGIGTPKRNTDPVQGWLVSWRRFAHRNS